MLKFSNQEFVSIVFYIWERKEVIAMSDAMEEKTETAVDLVVHVTDFLFDARVFLRNSLQTVTPFVKI